MGISVTALPVDDIIKDLAEQWQIGIKQESGELILELPENLGEGFIRGTTFESGIGVIEYNCAFVKDYEITFTKKETHPLKFIFCSKGEVDHGFNEDDDRHTIQTFQNVIVSSSGNNGHLLKFRANEKVHVTSIEIMRSIFSRRDNHHFNGLPEDLKELFQDSVAEKKFFYQGNYSIRSADIVDEINTQKLDGFLRSIFLEAKLFEMLTMQIQQYKDDNQGDELPQILRKSDVEKVEKASRLINENISESYSVENLAKEVGTNVNKLQEGFKHLYGLTVNKYVQEVKLNGAKEMLYSTDNNISEIVSLIGLNNRSYFSKIFKERYGVSPKYFLKSHREKDEGDQDEK
ncbi:AraC family transcriptional regulator [Salegentibacter sp. F188]|uniref:AraC family transcriptional regulator n=1 Tax=Autumnicola patrickiae TaxID=3075591 RepID=A0ABU3DZ42_9FLAO|nr:AraC family transcriptional regulator [Salegentibacter sp. F188]MDT0688965.1 AraC family transcriptional regulator [Salegentibacter sp. F188]